MGGLAVIFPGQGSQTVGMGLLLNRTFPESREVFQAADAALGEPLSRLIFAGPEQELTLTANTQPAVMTVSIAAWQALRRRGIAADFLAGHSLGEYTALVAAGSMNFADAVRLVRLRGSYMQQALPAGEGAMAAVMGLDLEQVRQACNESAGADVVSAANMNSRARLERDIGRVDLREAQIPIITNSGAQPVRSAAELREALVRQVTSPVQWVESVRRLVSEGVDTFVEVGPGRVLSGLVRRIDRTVRVANVEDPDSLAQTLSLLKAA
ncbi:MAG: malonyl CoA-acyl carrier protein transacylase [Acidobacteria bacterium]|nr:MAG: malonyl CoA-acyl carrier protein transacylase [Acidobacteriota bacterium]